MEALELKPIEPQQDMEQGTKAANALVKLVDKAGLSKNFGGAKNHLYYEAWQAIGKFYGFSIKTGEAELIELDGIKGFRASASVLNDIGTVIGGAQAYCMRDEPNWKNRPLFQLASMAQTRAGSKAFRNILAFIPALAGFATTPAEEMDGVHDTKEGNKEPQQNPDEPDYRAEITNMLAEMWNEDEANMESALKAVTGFKGKNGWVDGTGDVFALKDKRNEKGASQLTIAYQKVKKEYEEWTKQGE